MDIRALYGKACSVCGGPAEIHMGKLSYCLDCYNHLADYLADVPSPTNDTYQILAIDPAGHAVEFSVERFSMGVRSEWTAVELLPDNDPRREWGYVGRSVSIIANMDELTQEQALDALSRKVQRMVGQASVEAHGVPGGQAGEARAHQPGQTLWALETGVARIERDESGAAHVVVDGQRLTGEQFLELLGCYEDDDLFWQVRKRTDDAPGWF